jgi:hypothetical protein
VLLSSIDSIIQLTCQDATGQSSSEYSILTERHKEISLSVANVEGSKTRVKTSIGTMASVHHVASFTLPFLFLFQWESLTISFLKPMVVLKLCLDPPARCGFFFYNILHEEAGLLESIPDSRTYRFSHLNINTFPDIRLHD